MVVEEGNRSRKVRTALVVGACAAVAAAGWWLEGRPDLEVRLVVPELVSMAGLESMATGADTEGTTGRWTVEGMEYAFDGSSGWTRARFGIDVRWWSLSGEDARLVARRRAAEAAIGLSFPPGILSVEVVDAGESMPASVLIPASGGRPAVDLVFDEWLRRGWLSAS